jgi:hypothetical protein
MLLLPPKMIPLFVIPIWYIVAVHRTSYRNEILVLFGHVSNGSFTSRKSQSFLIYGLQSSWFCYPQIIIFSYSQSYRLTRTPHVIKSTSLLCCLICSLYLFSYIILIFRPTRHPPRAASKDLAFTAKILECLFMVLMVFR